MKKPRVAPATFTAAYCCAYAVAFAGNWPLFSYYPLHGQFTWGRPALTGAGPGMVWYGLMADAALVATVAALCAGDQWMGAKLKSRVWLFACLAMVVSAFLLRRLFF